jgi:hypothetical protein
MDSRNLTRRRRLPRSGAVALAAALALAFAAVASATPTLSWSGLEGVTTSLTGVSCPTFSLCVAVEGTQAYTNTSPASGTTWSDEGTSAGGSLLAVSCAPGTSFCAAVGDSGALAATNNASLGGWTAPASLPDAANTLTSVSCPSSAFCLAVDNDGNAVYSTNAGTNWTKVAAIDATHTLTGVSCSTSSFCVAVDASGNILDSGTPTSAPWSVVGGANDLVGVSCSPGATCVAVDTTGHVWASSDASAASATWSETRIANSLKAVACTAEAMCIASTLGSVYASDDPASGAPSWVSQTPDPANTINAVSCTDQGLCAAVDGAGNALVASLGAPTVTTGTATATSQTTATLSATVNPGDATITSCYFNYGTSTGYGGTVPCSSTPSPAGGPQTVTAQVGGLTASTTYDFDVVAANNDGSATGANASFATPAPLRASPTISGTPAVGDTLTCNLGVSVPAGLTVTYKWVRDTTTIPGATAGTYVVSTADETHHLYCNAAISGDGGSAGASSGYVAVPAETLGTISETTVGKVSQAAGTVSTTVTCSPQAVSSCTVSLHLTTTGKHKAALGSSSTRITPGAQVKVSVSLNATGRRLLSAHHHLKATLTVSGTVVGVISAAIKRQTITLSAPRHARRRGR